MSLLHPFLEVVRSPETSGPITATALSSIDKFITYSVLSPSSPNLAIAMSQLSSAGTHCKFEASDSVSDEVVLLKILDVLRNCLTGHLGQVLSDESVCEMMETGLSMCCQMRLSGASSSSSSLEPPHQAPLTRPDAYRAQRCSDAPRSAPCRPWSQPSSPACATSRQRTTTSPRRRARRPPRLSRAQRQRMTEHWGQTGRA